MKDTLFFVLVLLIATISLNRGEAGRSIKIKKQCLNLLDYPRTGRSPKMTEFTRTDRASGLIAYPRVGRSDSSDYDAILDLNYDGRSRDDARPSSYVNGALKLAKAKRTGDAVSSGGMWFGPRLGRLHRRGEEPQAEDQQWARLPIREFQGSVDEKSENLTPRRLVEESDGEEAQSISNNGVY
ncbi:cardio acceleratory peptide 2b isoform X2 [Diprion similis]|uniref:cardio acceleratory peptide 2b isoform X2 n=1 Tax=Diprion similis TaxID=362088 RepID=UPI001EF79AA7|nr:cardio acceleratory peptide 2b isoform X2 [Diprion similis]